MSSLKMTILGLYRYGEYNQQDLFQNMKIPAGIDRQDLIDNILEQGAAFEILYPDFEYLQFSIGAWSKRWYRTMEKWLEALNVQYDPLNNYDRHEEWTDNDKVSGKTETIAGVNTTGQDELSVTAYDSDQYHKKEKTDSSGTSESTGSSETNTDGTSTHSGHLYGNIGVTTNNQLINQELEMLEKFNPYDWIAAKFERENFLQIY